MPNGPDINDFSGQSWSEGNYSHTQPSAPHARGAQSPCARCGATLVTSDRFCGACGSPHDRAPFAQSARAQTGVPRGYPPAHDGSPRQEKHASPGENLRRGASTRWRSASSKKQRRILTFGAVGVVLIAILLAFQLGSSQSSSPTPPPGATSGNSNGGEVSNASKAAACARVQTLRLQLNSINSQISTNLGNLTNPSNSAYSGAQSNLATLRGQGTTVQNELNAQNKACQGR